MMEPPPQKEAYAEWIVLDGKVVRATAQNSRNRRYRGGKVG